MSVQDTLTHARLIELLNYNPDTGVFTWKVRKANRLPAGSQAGWVENGRMRIKLDDHSYLAHRLAWFYIRKKWPTADIDHINRNALDNRIENLRDVSRAVNVRNVDRPRRNSRSGYLGVVAHKQKFQSAICVNGKRKYLGLFDTAEEAHNAYMQAKRACCPLSP